MGRPRKKIDADQVGTLARIGCTYSEIGAVVGCSTDTLKRRFADHIEKAREHGKSSLRHAQWQKALEGNPTMLIWLGKQELGQRDRQDVDTTVTAVDVARSVREAIRAMDDADGLSDAA